ncbi:MAG TPA: hypothetical protein VLM43_03955 [Desulfobacterales bacterium]|nr:hypothetical protein [Desulfobacterales bacterium]
MATPFLVLCPEFVLLEQIPLGQVTSLHCLRRRESHPPLFGVSSVLLTCPTSHDRSSLPCSLGIHSADLYSHPSRSVVGSPGSCAKSLCTCSGSLTTQGPVCSLRYRYNRCCLPPFGQRRHPEVYDIFRGSIAWPAHPLSTLRHALTDINA